MQANTTTKIHPTPTKNIVTNSAALRDQTTDPATAEANTEFEKIPVPNLSPPIIQTLHRIYVLFHSGKLDQGQNLFMDLMTISNQERRRDMCIWLASRCSQNQRVDLAVMFWQCASDIDQYHSGISYQLGTLLHQIGDTENAQKALSNAKRLASAKKEEDIAYDILDRGNDPKQALVHLEKSYKLNGRISTLRTIADLCHFQQRYDDEERIGEQLASMHDHASAGRYAIGRAKFAKGDHEGGVQAYRKFILEVSKKLPEFASKLETHTPEVFKIQHIEDFCKKNEATLHELGTSFPQADPPIFYPPHELEPTILGKPFKNFVAEIPDAQVASSDGVVTVKDSVVVYAKTMTPNIKQDNILPYTGFTEISKSTLINRPNRISTQIHRAALIGGRGSWNYFHWLLEFLPRVCLLDQIPETDDVTLLIRQDMPRQHLEALHLLNTKERDTLMLGRTSRIQCDTLFLPSVTALLPNPDDRRFLASEVMISPQAITRLRDQLRAALESRYGYTGRKVDFNQLHNQNLRRIFLSRAKSTNKVRKCVNEDHLFEMCKPYGFKKVHPADLSFTEQMEVFSQAEVVIGTGGAAFANLLFAPKGCTALCLYNHDSDANPYLLKSLTDTLEQKLIYVRGQEHERSHAYREQRSFKVNPDMAKELLKSMFGTTVH